MILVKLLFIILIIVSIVFRVLYIWDFALVLLAISIAIPSFFFVSTLILRFSLKFSLYVPENITEKSSPFDISINVVNNTFIPVPKAEAIIEYQNTVNEDLNEIELHFPIQSRNTQRVTFQLSSKFCGKIKVRTAYIIIYDPLRIFKAKVAKNIESEIIVMPSCRDVNGYTSDSLYIDDESNTFSQTKSGDDPSEVFDFHEYEYGDRLNRIHWKLSSKKDNFIVKELSLPVNEKIILFPDIFFTDISESILPLYDTALESLMSLSFLLLENGQPHYIIYGKNEIGFSLIYIDDLNALSSLIFSMINEYNIKNTESHLDTFFSENPELCCSSFTLISPSLNSNTINIVSKCVEAEIKNIVYTVESPEKADSIPDSDDIHFFAITAGKITSSISEIAL